MVSIYRVKNIIKLEQVYVHESADAAGSQPPRKPPLRRARFLFYFWASGRARTRVLYLYYYIIVNSRGGRAASAVLRGTFNSRPAAN